MPVEGFLQCGNWKVSVLSAGQVKMDGGAIFGVVPKPLWEKKLIPDARNRVTLAMNCLVVENEDEYILVETGFGGKVDAKLRDIYDLNEDQGLLPSMAYIGIAPNKVTRVILTHLHQDHAGGCTLATSDGYVPTFPNADYYVQDGEWLDAQLADGQTVNGYRVVEVMRPIAESVVRLSGPTQICAGVRVMLTPGHTRCHQCVVVETNTETFCYVGDLIPTTHHLKSIYILAYDLYPRETYLNKQRLLEQAVAENWIVIWSHDLQIPWSRVTRNDRGEYVPVPI